MNTTIKQEVTRNHWGIWVHSESPVTGVLSNHDIEFLHDAMYDEDGINLDWESHRDEYHIGGMCTLPDWDEPTTEDECAEFWEEQSDTYIIGDWRKDQETGQYEPIENGPRGYAAIVGEFYTQVVWSKHTTRASLCSPCYPGQADVPSDGPFLAYTMPPEYMGEDAD